MKKYWKNFLIVAGGIALVAAVTPAFVACNRNGTSSVDQAAEQINYIQGITTTKNGSQNASNSVIGISGADQITNLTANTSLNQLSDAEKTTIQSVFQSFLNLASNDGEVTLPGTTTPSEYSLNLNSGVTFGNGSLTTNIILNQNGQTTTSSGKITLSEFGINPEAIPNMVVSELNGDQSNIQMANYMNSSVSLKNISSATTQEKINNGFQYFISNQLNFLTGFGNTKSNFTLDFTKASVNADDTVLTVPVVLTTSSGTFTSSGTITLDFPTFNVPNQE